MSAAGERHEQARYRVPEGQRGIYAQRVEGRVALTDAPIDFDGRVLLIERHLQSNDELRALVADYLEQSTAARAPAVHAPSATARLLDKLRRCTGGDAIDFPAIGHAGGRLIWQLAAADELLVAWHEVNWAETACDYEKRLLAQFDKLHGGRRPFANLTG